MSEGCGLKLRASRLPHASASALPSSTLLRLKQLWLKQLRLKQLWLLAARCCCCLITACHLLTHPLTLTSLSRTPGAYDVAVLVSGDKDFMPALSRIRQKGKRVALCSMRNCCARDLLDPR